ncbi:MAG: CHAT domain-containing protein [Myxococcota bacterium]
MAGRSCAVAIAALCLGCTPEGTPKRAPAPVVVPQMPLEVDFTGCFATTRDPLRCELKGEETLLRFWVPGTRTPPELAVQGPDPLRLLEGPAEVDGGFQVVAAIPNTAEEIRVSVASDEARRVWSVPVTRAPAAVLPDEIRARLNAAPSNSDALRAADEELGAALPKLRGNELLEALRLQQAVQYELLDWPRSIASGRAALRQAVELGRFSRALDVVAAMAPLLEAPGERTEAKLLLDEAALYSGMVADGEQQLLIDYYRGTLAARRSDNRSAVRLLQRAQQRARRLGVTEYEVSALSKLVVLDGVVGLRAEQAAAIDRMLGVVNDPNEHGACIAVEAASNAAWGVLLTRLPQSPALADKLLEDALAAFGTSDGCNTASGRRNGTEARLNYVLSAVAAGDAKEVRARLDPLAARALGPGQDAWASFAQGWLALAEGDGRTAARTLQAIEASGDLLLAWQTAVVRGLASETLGRNDDALTHYLAAEGHLDHLSESFALDRGREGLVASRETGASRAVALLMSSSRFAEAFAVARHSRSRTHRMLRALHGAAGLTASQRSRRSELLEEYRQTYETMSAEVEALRYASANARRDRLARHTESRARLRRVLAEAEALSASAVERPSALEHPVDGELWVLLHRAGEGWAVLLADVHGVTGKIVAPTVDIEDRDAFAREFLEPFVDRLRAAKRLRILPTGETWRIPVHALTVAGDPLIELAPVEYAFDSGPRPQADTRRPAALVVADPQTGTVGSLPGAAAEGTAVRAELVAQGWTVSQLSGERANGSRVLQQLRSATHFHYAGHGESRGSAGWDSGLSLANGDVLGVRDVLSLGDVPQRVVLTGCETATSEDAGVGRMSVAAAFLLTGSGEVVGSDSTVPDAAARLFAEALYASLSEDSNRDAAQAVRRVQQTLQRDGASGWAAFRTYVP